MPDTIFNLPDLGEGLQDAEIVSWHVSVGDHVVTDQPLVAVETDKAVVEVPAPHSGRVARLCAESGERVKVGEPLIEFEAGAHADSGTVVGAIAAKAEPKGRGGGAAEPPTTKVKATPAVRALAHKLDVDLSVVQGTGRDGAVTAQDVERAAKTLAEAGPPEPLRGVRRTMAEKMAQSRTQIVPATVTDDADVEAWPEDTYKGSGVTLRLIRAVAAGCAAAPELNAWFDGKALTRRLHQRVDLGVAVNTDDGLFVPVLRDAGNRDADDLARGLERLKADVEARTVPPEELRGQTITLSNFGTLAGRYGSLVIVPPQVAILGAGRIVPKVVAVNGAPAVHRVLPLSVTFDHRAVTGGEAAQFLAAAVADLEKAT